MSKTGKTVEELRLERLKRSIEHHEEEEKQNKIDASLDQKTDDFGGPNQRSYVRDEKGDWVGVPKVITQRDQKTVKEVREFKKDEELDAVAKTPSQSPDSNKKLAVTQPISGKSKDSCSIQ